MPMVEHLEKINYAHHIGVVRSHDSFYRDDEMEVCNYWHQRGIIGADMETSALFTLGRLRGLRVASILNNVVEFEQDVKEGVAQYADNEQSVLKGEKTAALAALNALAQ